MSELKDDAAELAAWNDVKETSNIGALSAFLRKYPNGVHASEAQARLDTLRKAEAEEQAAAEEKRKELDAWNDVKGASDVSALNAFIVKYPNGAHAGEAQAWLDSLKGESEEASAWSGIEDSSDIAALNAFLARYPNGKHAASAQARVSKLKDDAAELAAWNDLEGWADISALTAFLQKYPNGAHAGEAQAQLDTLKGKATELAAWNGVKDTSDISALNAFIAKFPNGTHAALAQARLDKLEGDAAEFAAWTAVKDTTDLKALSSFLKKYPDGEHAADAQAQLDRLRKLSTQTFAMHDNYDLAGSDLRKIEEVDQVGCESACRTDTSCKGYTYDKWNHLCILKSAAEGLTINAKAISGIRAGTPEPRPSADFQMRHFRGSALFAFSGETTSNASSFDVCEQRCQAATACIGFTFFKTNKQCHLMASARDRSADTAADSGAKFGD